MRVVFDTNVLIDAAHEPLGASAKLLQAVREGELEAFATPATIREYRLITGRLVSDQSDQAEVLTTIEQFTIVRPTPVDLQIDDPEDLKFVQAAVGGSANALVTSDRHLLQVGEIGSIRIITPVEAWAALQEERGDSSEWGEWLKGFGIGS